MDRWAPSSPLPVRANRAPRRGAHPESVSFAAPTSGELYPGHHPVDDSHGRLRITAEPPGRRRGPAVCRVVVWTHHSPRRRANRSRVLLWEDLVLVGCCGSSAHTGLTDPPDGALRCGPEHRAKLAGAGSYASWQLNNRSGPCSLWG